MVSKKRSMKRGHKMARKVMKRGGDGTPVTPQNALYNWCCDNTNGVCTKKDASSLYCDDNDTKYKCFTDDVDPNQVIIEAEKYDEAIKRGELERGGNCVKSMTSELVEKYLKGPKGLTQYIPPAALDGAKGAVNEFFKKQYNMNFMPQSKSETNPTPQANSMNPLTSRFNLGSNLGSNLSSWRQGWRQGGNKSKRRKSKKNRRTNKRK
jgi:hypothetical protein